MNEILIADLETNGISPSEIYIVGVLNYTTDEYTQYYQSLDEISVGLMRLNDARLIIGHNFIKYDSTTIRKLTEGVIDIPETKIIDTLTMSRKLFPDMKKHSLGEWGDIFDYPKIDYKLGFDRFHPEMLPYCERDCRLNKRLYDFLISQETNKLS